jgi:NRPS condensation-like uncharacterized protein
MPFPYRLHSTNTLSTTQLRQALQLVIIKHQSLRTSLIFDKQNNILIQRISNFTQNNNKLFPLIESTFETDDQLNNIIYNERFSSELFDLSQGVVFRCHIIYYEQISTKDTISEKDAIIFNFHHALFDVESMNIFLHDLHEAYTTGGLPVNNNTVLHYLDCKYQIYFFNHN